MKHQINISDDATKRVHQFQEWLNNECRTIEGTDALRVEYSIHDAFEKIVTGDGLYQQYCGEER